MTPLFRADSGVGPGGVNKGQHRSAELLGQPHQAQRLPVPFRIGHAEVSIHALLQRFALLVAYHDDRAAIEAGKAADDRMIVGEGAISVQFNKAIAQAADVVQSRGPLQMTCDLCTLPSRQARIDLGLQLMESRPELIEIFLTPAARVRGGGKLFELLLELGDRLFKVEIFAHGYSYCSDTAPLPTRASTSPTSRSLGRTRRSGPTAITDSEWFEIVSAR